MRTVTDSPGTAWKLVTYGALAFLFSLFAFALPVQAQDIAAADEAIVNGVISVKLDPGAVAAVEAFTNERGAVTQTNARGIVQTGLAGVDQLNQRFGAAEMRRIFRPAGRFEARHREYGLHQWYEIRFDNATSVRSAVQAYNAISNIAIAEPQYRKTRDVLGNYQAASPAQTDEAPSAIPDDPEYGVQWHYNNTEDNVGTPDADINLPEAHDIQTGNSEVIVSIVDGGLDMDHPDFEGMLWVNEGEIPGNGIDDDDNGYVDDVHGYDHADDDGEPEANGSHGTHVAGTVAAKNGNGQHGGGVAGGNGSEGSGIRLMINKTFGTTINAGFAESVVYAADMGAVVSQNSWGYEIPGVFEQAVLDAIDYFNENAGGPDAPMDGGLYVSAAGNDNDDGEWYPGFYEGAYAVAATDEHDERAGYSNYGEWVEISAPGGGDDEGTFTDPCGLDADDVWSTVVGGFGNNCGTSMAAPHVSGAIGLIASASPGIAAEEVKSILKETGVELDTDQPIGPRIDVFAALQSLDPNDETPPAAITDLATTGVSSNAIDLAWTAPGDDGDDGTANTYSLRWSADGPITTEADFENANPVAGVPAPEPAGTVQNHTVSGLPYSTEVYFAIRATDNMGNTGDLSNSPSATTEPGPVISVDPESFDVALEVDNSTEETLTISHVGAPGAVPLEWTASVGPAPELTTTPSEVAAPSAVSGSAGRSAILATANPSYDGVQNDVEETAMTYQLDDGTSENALGLGGLGDTFDMMWLNGFQTVEGAGTVTTIATTWGADGSANVPPEGMTGLAVVYNDPNNDGNPSDAVLLSQTEITVTDPGTNNFTTVEIAPTPVEGTFFIGVLLEDNHPNWLPAPMDQSSTYQGASWFAGTITGEDFNLEDLSANSTPPRADYPANWLLRAEGSTGFLALSPTDGSIEQGQSQDVTATFDATGVTPGIYEASINVTSNDPIQPVTSVPSTLEVTAGPPEITVDPEELSVEAFSGTTIIDTITVSNTGGTALEVTEATLSGDDAFSFVNPDDGGGYTIPFEGSRDIAVEFAPNVSGSFSSTFEIDTEQGVSASVAIQGEGAPFVTIEPGELTESIDLSTGDSTATQTFTVTNEFDESLPFSVFIETIQGEDINVYPQLVDEKLVRWQEMQEAGPATSLRGSEPAETSLEAAPKPEGAGTKSGFARLLDAQPLEAVGITAYGNEVLASELVSFDLGVPGDLTVLGEGFDSYAGNFTFANNEEIYWIENETNLLKTYNIEDGSIEEIGELEPGGLGVVWTDMETDPTTGTTYVTSAEGSINRLYELDVVDAELNLIGDFAGGGQVAAFAIDDEGEAYAHDISDDVIWSVDLETAESEVIGTTGIDANYAQSMTWDGETGQLLMAAYHGCNRFGCFSSTLRQVDRETGMTTPIGAFPDGADDEFGWIVTKGQGTQWLSTNLEQGTLPAGATVTLEATFDATKLVEGDYQAQINIAGKELQGEPSERIPVSLSVSADPVVFLSKDSLNFDPTFVGGTTSPQMVTLRNDGADDMTITDVSTGSDAFQFEGETAFTLEPGEAKVFEVWFAPTEVTDYAATLSFEGESVSGAVTLEGVGIEAPVLAVNPESFEKQAYLGQVQEHTVAITNEGGNPLEYDLSILPSTPPTQVILLEEETFDGTFPPEGWSRTGTNNGENWQQGSSNNAGGEAPEAEFFRLPYWGGTQRLITPAMDTEGLGHVVAQFDHYVDTYRAGEYEVRLESSGDGGETWTTVATFPADDIPATREVITIDNEDVGSDQFHLAWTFDGDSWDLNWWDIDNVTVFVEGNWLTVEPESGTLAPGESEELTLSVDTNVPGMEEGTVESGLQLVTNDPAQPVVTVPLSLEVIEALAVTPEPEVGEDEAVHPNETFSVPLTVESLDDLAVRSYELTLGFDSDKFEALAVETDGTLSDGLTLASNITEGEVQIAAAESEGAAQEGAAAPILFDLEGEGTLVNITMRAKEALGTGAIALEAMLFNEGAPPASAHADSVAVAPLYGDVSLNLEVSAFDAAQALQYAVGALELGETAVVSGDVTGDGTLGALDAAHILDFAVGTIDCFPDVEPCEEDETGPALASKQKGTGQKSQAAPSATLAWGEVQRATPSAKASGSSAASSSTSSGSASAGSGDEDGQALELPLALREASGPVRALTLTTRLDPAKVALDDVQANLPEGWQLVHHASDDGTLRLALAGTAPLEGGRNLATLKLRWLDEEAAELEIAGEAIVNEAGAQEIAAASIAPIPDRFALKGNYPNPFGQATRIALDLPARAEVRIEVYDVLGRRVMVAHDGEIEAGTNRTVEIDGGRLASGLYLYRVVAELEGERQVETGRMTLVR